MTHCRDNCREPTDAADGLRLPGLRLPGENLELTPVTGVTPVPGQNQQDGHQPTGNTSTKKPRCG